MSPVTEITDPQVVKAEVVEYIGNALEEARELSVSITDDASCERAVSFGAMLKDKIAYLKNRRKVVYEPLKAATEGVRLEYDNPLKLGDQMERALSAAVITFKQKKRAEEERLRLAAEAEAKRQKEEADRKEREAQAERERIIRERQAREQKERDDRLAEEKRQRDEEARIKAEADAKAKAEADARAKQLAEEEERRLASAQEAHDVGLSERSETILDAQQPVAPLPAPLPSTAELAAKAEKERKEREDAEAEEKRKADAKAAEDKKREEEAAHLRKLDDEAAAAKALAAEKEAEASQQVTVTRPDDRMRTNVSWKYDVPDLASLKKLCRAVAEGRAPAEYVGFDPEQPQKFRGTAALQRDVTRLKDQFEGTEIGIRTWPEESGSFKAAA